jgi:tetratricopeptide (TPR) repeat protein
MAYWILGEVQNSIEDLDFLINCSSEFPCSDSAMPSEFAEAYSNRGFVYREMGQPLRAIEVLDEAIRLDPNSSAAYNNRGIAYSDLGEYQQAIQDYDEAIRLDGVSIQAYLNRGVAHVELGRPDRAIGDSLMAITLAPQQGGGYALGAVAYTLLGDEAEARRHFDRAVELGFSPDFLERELWGAK